MDYISLTVRVTEEHISKGKKRDCSYCPIAISVKSYLKEIYSVQVGSYITITNEETGKRNLTDLQIPLLGFINYFDNDLQVYPFEFTISIPKEFVKEKYLQC